MNTQVYDGLVRVKELISTPEKWTKNYDARDKNGEIVRFCDDSAVCWCLSGALAKIFADDEMMEKAADIINNHVSGDGSYWDWNDLKTTTHEQVMQVLDAAIEEAKNA